MNSDIIKIRDKEFRVLSILPYRLTCELEIMLMEMMSNIEENPFEEDDGSETLSWTAIKKIDFRKKMKFIDNLLINMVVDPPILKEDLDDPLAAYNSYLKDLGDELFVRYMEKMARKEEVKKKL